MNAMMEIKNRIKLQKENGTNKEDYLKLEQRMADLELRVYKLQRKVA